MPTYRQPGAGPRRIRPGLPSNPGLPRGEPGADKNVKRPGSKTDSPRVEGELGANEPRTRADHESNLGWGNYRSRLLYKADSRSRCHGGANKGRSARRALQLGWSALRSQGVWGRAAPSHQLRARRERRSAKRGVRSTLRLALPREPSKRYTAPATTLWSNGSKTISA